VFQENLSIDESMVPYYGRQSCKMFIRGKPICFGYKLWVIAGKDGYPYHVKIYTGRDEVCSASPLGTRVVEHMIAVVESHSDPEPPSVLRQLLHKLSTSEGSCRQ